MIELNSAAPHLCVSVYNADTTNGTPVIAMSCSGAFQDEWNYADGAFSGLGTANGVGKCLTASGGLAGSLVVLDACPIGGGVRPVQTWFITNGTFYGFASSAVITLGRDLCLDSSGGPSVGLGTQLVINKCNGAASQNWIVQ